MLRVICGGYELNCSEDEMKRASVRRGVERGALRGAFKGTIEPWVISDDDDASCLS